VKTDLTLKQLRDAIAERSANGHRAYEEAGDELDFGKVKCFGEGLSTRDKVEKMRQLNAELTDYQTDLKELEAIATTRKRAQELDTEFNKPSGGMVQPDGKGEKRPEFKNIGRLLFESGVLGQEGKRVRLDVDAGKALLGVELKTDFFTSSGWAPESLRAPGYVPSPTRPIAVIDHLPIYPTSQNSVKYMLESTLTNNAAEKAEGGAAGESALALTETTDEVEEVSTFIPTSRVQLEDVALAEAYLTNRINFLVRQRLDYQILQGNGSTPNLLGTVSVASINTQAKSTDTGPDAIYKAFDLIRVNGFTEPSVLFSNPADWQDIRLLRTADGIYIFGNPADAGPLRIWGVPVVQTTSAVANTMVTGDYANFAYVAMRRGVEVEMSSGYTDYFVKGKLAVLASLRCAVVHTRVKAFCTVTGM